MSRYGKTILFRGLKLLHYLVSVSLFGLFWFSLPQVFLSTGGILENLLFPTIYAVVLLLLLRTYNAYDLTFSGVAENAFSQSLSHAVAAALVYALLVIAHLRLFNPLPLLMLLVVQILGNLFWSHVTASLYRRLCRPLRTVVVYGENGDPGDMDALKSHLHHFHITHRICLSGTDSHTLLSRLEGFEAVFILGTGSSVRNDIAKFCVAQGMECFSAPYIGDILMTGAQHLEPFSIPIMRISRSDIPPEYRFFKRALDILLSAVGLIAASPVMLVTALAIRLYDGGPVFYRQTRLTRNGKHFRIIKFRSMRMDAESDGVARLATRHDSRITPVGRFIRACRIDELPQLFNILMGDMSLVGPRPERPEIAAEYEKTLPEFALRLQVKAGLTGFAQIYGRYNTAPYEKLQMDLLYIGKMSMMLDLKLIFATFKILLKKESTTGVEDGSTTAIS